MIAGQIDIEEPAALLHYLRQAGRIAPEEAPTTTILRGGVSNRTVLLQRESGQAWVLKQALEKLRVAVEWHSDPIRIEREALGMVTLAMLLPDGAVPKLVFLDPAQHLLAMEAVPQPHDNFKSLLMAGRIEPDNFRQFGELLAAIHRGGWVRRDEFATAFADRQFFESLRLEPYYLYPTTLPSIPGQARDFLLRLIERTRRTQDTLVHGDYSPKNILVHDGKLILLDHEVIHFGDPAFDIGFSFAHLLSKAHHFPALRGAFADAASLYWNTYFHALGDLPWGAKLPERCVHHSLACLLARCVGRSPLEYLTDTERRRQIRSVCDLMQQPPATPTELITAFVERISHADD
jgi:tRNA A-37 threonylcarbamoyl transferase component Bud32